VDNPIEGHHEVAPSAQFRLPLATKLNVEHDALSSRMLAQNQPSPPLRQATNPRLVACFVVSPQTPRGTPPMTQK
jgi:hypothetical protein